MAYHILRAITCRLAIIGLAAWGLARPAMADPALWMARGRSATVYLFGTIHVLPQADGGAWLDAPIRKALDASTELWTEADVGNLSGSVAAIRHYGLDATHSSASLLPPAYRARFVRQIAEGGAPPALVARARPWLAEILLNGAAMRQAGPMVLGAEATLLAYARAHHMLTPTFETLDQQFAMLADMPQEAQLASLEEQIDEFDQTGPIFAHMLAAWRAGDEAGLDRMTNTEMRSHSEAIWTELILRRNERFAQKIGDRLQGTGTAFVAVGAAHLCGLTGVPALLRNAGFTVTRLQ
jgi:uncharacterized protein YbaP (TraB family)